MSLSTYGDLKTAVASWLERDDQTTRIPDFIALAESRIYTALRVLEMEANEDVTVTISTRNTALPTRFSRMRSVYITDTTRFKLEYRTPDEYWSVHANRTTARPDIYTIEGTNIIWGPLPDAGYTATTQFFQIPAALSSDADFNSVLTRWPGLYLSASLLEASTFLEDDVGAIKWSTMYDDTLEKALAADQLDRTSHG